MGECQRMFPGNPVMAEPMVEPGSGARLNSVRCLAEYFNRR